jgi:DNA-directed RNA polymerase specialized sigma24 family protein
MATAPNGSALRQIQVLFVERSLGNLRDGELLDRFIATGDEAAFTALVERHGLMVPGTCRAVLRDTNAAKDAFQATFLVLVCKARSIRGRGALASWTYQVAHRIALQAGAEAARERKRERLVGHFKVTDGHRVEPDDEWREILHEEVARLADKYRLPLLLCDLGGKTHVQAAAELR